MMGIRYSKQLNISLLVLITSLFVTYIMFSSVQASTKQEIQTYIDFRVMEAIQHIEHQLSVYEEVLHGVDGLFKASDNVDRKEFKKYISSLRLADNYPGIQGVGFSLIIPPKKMAAHVETIRNEGFPAYTVHPEGERETYSSIIFLEPFSGRNLRAFGYDMFSESVRQFAMQKAIKSGNVAMSGKVRLVQESGKNEQSGFLMYLPIYQNDKPHILLPDRNANIVGWAYSVFRMNDFMEGALGKYTGDLDVEIFDGETISYGTMMYDSDNSVTKENVLANADFQEVPLSVVDHKWTVRVRPLATIESRVDSSKPVASAVVGIVASFAITLIIWLLLSGRASAIIAAKAMNKELLYEQHRLSSIIEGTHVGIWEWNVPTGETAFNEYWAQIIGYTLSELEPISIETWMKYSHPDDLERSSRLLEKHFTGESPYYECEVRMKHKGGHWVWVLDKGKVATWTLDGKPLLMFGTHQEITEQKNAEENLLHDLQHDTLTGLPNRTLLSDRLQQALLIGKRNNSSLAVMFLDLDKFKSINDTLGHDVGDLLLIETAKRIQNCIRESDTAARIGGDEFIVLLPTVESVESAVEVAEKIRLALSLPFDFPTRSVAISASIGIAMYPEHGDDEQLLFRNADIAMYDAKNSGLDCVKIFQTNVEMKEPAQLGEDEISEGSQNHQ